MYFPNLLEQIFEKLNLKIIKMNLTKSRNYDFVFLEFVRIDFRKIKIKNQKMNLTKSRNNDFVFLEFVRIDI